MASAGAPESAPWASSSPAALAVSADGIRGLTTASSSPSGATTLTTSRRRSRARASTIRRSRVRPGASSSPPVSMSRARASAPRRLWSRCALRTDVPSVCSEERIRSTSTLNQRSMVCWMRSLPTAITSTAGATAIRMNTSIRRMRKRAPSTRRRRSITTRTRLRPRKSTRTRSSADVHDDEAVEQHRREEVGREVAALAQEDLQADEDGQGGGGPEEDQRRVVAEGRAAARSSRRHCSLGATLSRSCDGGN